MSDESITEDESLFTGAQQRFLRDLIDSAVKEALANDENKEGTQPIPISIEARVAGTEVGSVDEDTLTFAATMTTVRAGATLDYKIYLNTGYSSISESFNVRHIPDDIVETTTRTVPVDKLGLEAVVVRTKLVDSVRQSTFLITIIVGPKKRKAVHVCRVQRD